MKKVDKKKVTKKAVPDEILVMQTQISNILTLVKELTEVVDNQNKMIEKVKNRMGL
tara:strand:- start:1080 stop:1247 length:168 start_codon:yes stop_codon:yes gene_type:complete